LIVLLLTTMTVRIEAAEDEHGNQEMSQHGGHQNHLALFLGNTHFEGENGTSIGLDYERRLNQHIGIGGVMEYAGGEFSSWLFGIPLFIHPCKDVVLVVAPGIINEDNHNDSLLRLGVSYLFEVGHYAIGPQFNLDLIDGEEVKVYGISIGRGF
jgi:hypothetical protein